MPDGKTLVGIMQSNLYNPNRTAAGTTDITRIVTRILLPLAFVFAYALTRSCMRYKALLRLSWLQDAAPAEGGPALRIYLPGGDGISGVSGWLRLHGGRAAALSADLETVQAGAQREPLGLRLQQRQSLAPDTTHYFDSAGLGLLVRVTPAR